MKLRGRTLAPESSRGCTLCFSTHGYTTEFHGALERLLDGTGTQFKRTGVACTTSTTAESFTYPTRNPASLCVRWKRTS